MKAVFSIIIICCAALFASAQSTSFTYQGKLTDNTLPANGNYELEFRVFAANTGGQPIGNRVVAVNAAVVNGIFTVELDFGSPMFGGAERFLEISVRRNSNEQFQTLAPRQHVTSSPYAIRALNSETALVSEDTTKLGGVDAGQYVLTTDTRMSDERNPLAGSANYIQNGTSPQSSSNFNISGDGRADSFSANTQFNIGFDRILGKSRALNLFVGTGQSNTIESDFNTFVGITAGRDATTGDGNTFLGSAAGRATTTGSSNTFLGRSAGINNLEGEYNSFVGKESGFFNTSGTRNTFVGGQAGLSNSTGNYNTFTGIFSGLNNQTASFGSFYGAEAGRENAGNANSFFGSSAGRRNTSGNNNAFFGADAGRFNTTGANNAFLGTFSGMNSSSGNGNTFVGASAGLANVGGTANTLLGASADLGAANLTNATAIGANTVVSQSNSLILGNNANVGIGTSTPGSKLTVAGLIESTTGGVKFPDGTTQTTAATLGNFIRNSTSPQLFADFNIAGTGRANVLTANDQFNLGNQRFLSSPTLNSVVLGIDANSLNMTGVNNTFVGQSTGRDNTTGSSNSFVGSLAGIVNADGSNNSFFGGSSGFRNTSGSQNSFFGERAGVQTSTGSFNTFVGAQAGQANETGTSNVSIGARSGMSNAVGSNNVYVGTGSGFGDMGNNNTLIGANANTIGIGLSFATAIGSQADVTTNNTIVLGRPTGADKVRIPGLGSGGSVQLCRNSSNEIATCDSLAGGVVDNAVAQKLADQQKLIDAQQQEVEAQRKQLALLTAAICSQNKDAAVCSEVKK